MPADLVVRAAAVRTMDQAAGPVTALAVRDGTIAAAAGPDGEAGRWPPGAARTRWCSMIRAWSYWPSSIRTTT